MSEQAADKKSPAVRVGRHRPFIMAGTAASGAVSLFRVFLCNERGFMAANLLSGLASAMWISFMVFYTGKFGKEDQQRATSRIVMFNNLGMLLGFTASTLCYSGIGMRNLCLFSVAAGGMAFCLSLLLKKRKEAGSQRPNGRQGIWFWQESRCGDYNRESILLRKEKC